MNTLPRALETGTCLAFESVDTYVTVRVDGEEIYRNAEPGGRLWSMWNFVRLDASRAEGRVTLEFSGPDPFDTGTLPEIFLGPYTEILLVANSQLRVNSQAGITILLFGIFVLLFALASLNVVATMSDETTKDVTAEAAVTGYNKETAGEQTLTVTVGEATTTLTVTVKAAGPAELASGVCGVSGDNVTWVLTDDGVLTIRGTGAMADYAKRTQQPWKSYTFYLGYAVFCLMPLGLELWTEWRFKKARENSM